MALTDNTTGSEDRVIEVLVQAKNLNLDEVLDIVKRLDEDLTETRKALEETKEYLQAKEMECDKLQNIIDMGQ